MPSLTPNFNKICSTLDCILQNSGEYEVVLVLQRTGIEIEDKIKKHFSFNAKLKIINDTARIAANPENIAFWINAEPNVGEIVSIFSTSNSNGNDPVKRTVCSLFI